MRAAILNKQNEYLIVDEVETMPLEVGQVLIFFEISKAKERFCSTTLKYGFFLALDIV